MGITDGAFRDDVITLWHQTSEESIRNARAACPFVPMLANAQSIRAFAAGETVECTNSLKVLVDGCPRRTSVANG